MSRYRHLLRWRNFCLVSTFLFAVAILLGSPFYSVVQSAGNDKAQASRRSAFSVNAPYAQDRAGKPVRYPQIDVRVNRKDVLSRLTQKRLALVARQAQTQAAEFQEALSRLKARVPSVDAKISPLTGAVEVLRSAGTLTGPNRGRSGVDIVRDFISTNRSLYGLAAGDIAGLHFMGESINRVSGLRMIRVEQTVNGLPVFQTETRFMVDRDGRLVRSTGLFIPNAAANASSLTDLISAQQALQKAMASVDITLDLSQMSLAQADARGTKGEVTVSNSRVTGTVPSKLVYFPLVPGVLVPAWSQVTFTDAGADWYTIVDATSGELLWRKNIRNNVSTQQARFSVYVQADGFTPADSPAPKSPTTAVPGAGTQFPEIARTTVNMLTVQNILASPNGWIDDCPVGGCSPAQTSTTGNNVDAYLDRVVAGAENNVPDVGALDNNGRPIGNPDAATRNRDFLGTAPRDFQTGYLPPPQGGDPEAGQTATGAPSATLDSFRRGAVTQLFYITNWYHDQLFILGFDEAAGNFQQTNFSGTGSGGDRVLAEAQDGGDTNNANFSTPPDGVSGRMQMYRFTGPIIDRDGGLDAEIVMHELTHGTSNRLIGNGAGLNWSPGVGMGEGWSDFYALSLLNNTNADDPNAQYASGAYVTYKLAGLLDNYVYGIRRFPYSTDNSIEPMTWADVDQTTADYSGGIPISPIGFEFAGAMEVHNIGEVWCMTLWEVRSRIIASNGGDVPTGNNITLSLITDALKMTPINPSFTDARDAIIDADCAANGCNNEESIWNGFADRGLGYNAFAPLGIELGPVSPHMGIRESFLAPYLDVQSVTIDDSFGNNNGAIDPGESIRIIVKLLNPWRSPSKDVASATATLITSTPGVFIQDGNSTYPAIPAQGSADGDTFRFAVPGNATCGQSLKFTITPESNIGSTPVNFTLRVGAPGGAGQPIPFINTPNLSIPDNAPVGAFTSVNIPEDFEIVDLDLRIDSLTHTFPGDLTVMLKGPTGYGTDLLAFLGILADGGGGDNIANMVISDEGELDMLVAPDTAAPYAGDWSPIFNSPTWAFTGLGPGDPVGQLSHFDGTSTEGTWTVLVSDQGPADIGTLNTWSLIVTPRLFTCTPPVPTADPATISGTITTGDGQPLPGVSVHLGGFSGASTITDSSGNYRFDGIQTEGFYTVTPSLVNYHFSPSERSFNLLGNRSDAVFTAIPDAVIRGNAIDSSDYFVRQQYLDFLGREPDQGGFAYWTAQLATCNGNADCLRRRRIDVSAAFFDSREFQEGGSFVFRLYKTALGRQLGYSEFLVDRSQVVTGPTLEQTKLAFASAFVQRTEFLQRYQNNSTAESFVDALLETMRGAAGVDLSSERANLISKYNSGGSQVQSRALVVRDLADNGVISQSLYNSSFVLMEYFAYLRRDPDQGGYDFWLGVLNNREAGNYRGMVCAFLTSEEYQRRFGTIVTRSNGDCSQ